MLSWALSVDGDFDEQRTANFLLKASSRIPLLDAPGDAPGTGAGALSADVLAFGEALAPDLMTLMCLWAEGAARLSQGEYLLKLGLEGGAAAPFLGGDEDPRSRVLIASIVGHHGGEVLGLQFELSRCPFAWNDDDGRKRR